MFCFIKITQHPEYVIGDPLRGADIAVYHVKNPKVITCIRTGPNRRTYDHDVW